jgi:peptidoglycan biosynthesis protein MviN/MurJ (putative lipid II flippase)
LWITAKRFGQAAHVLKTSISRIRGAFLGSLAMGIVLWAVNQNFYVAMETSSERVFFAFGLIFLGATTYLVIVYVLKVFPKNLEKVYEKNN